MCWEIQEAQTIKNFWKPDFDQKYEQFFGHLKDSAQNMIER